MIVPGRVEDRVQRREDLEALREDQYPYCAQCDAGYAAANLVTLFTEDAIWEGGAMGVLARRAPIREFFADGAKKVAFALHGVGREEGRGGEGGST